VILFTDVTDPNPSLLKIIHSVLLPLRSHQVKNDLQG
jgi:hypothetical protein